MKIGLQDSAATRRQTFQKTASRSVLLLFAAFALWFPLSAGARRSIDAQVTAPRWRPNRAVAGAHYLGSAACARCHSAKVKVQQAAPMGRAMELPAACEVLRQYTKLTFRNGPYSYEISRDGDRSIYSVTDGVKTISEPILFAFGLGVAGQTYVFQRNGEYVEGRVSFYRDTKSLDLTIGHIPSIPPTLEEAAGRVMKSGEAQDCFGCHSTAAVGQNKIDVERLIPGVSCEACHGPGESHIAAVKAGNFEGIAIFNPKTLGTEELSNFCGSCHRTWEQVALMGMKGVNNVRFQPYRLTNSRCYDSDDRRISCLACHDPHQDVSRDAASYDAKCTACHAKQAAPQLSKDRVAAVCQVGKQNCATCHMRKYDLPGGHFRFTDHHIRVVRPGDPYPN